MDIQWEHTHYSDVTRWENLIQAAAHEVTVPTRVYNDRIHIVSHVGHSSIERRGHAYSTVHFHPNSFESIWTNGRVVRYQSYRQVSPRDREYFDLLFRVSPLVLATSPLDAAAIDIDVASETWPLPRFWTRIVHGVNGLWTIHLQRFKHTYHQEMILKVSVLHQEKILQLRTTAITKKNQIAKQMKVWTQAAEINGDQVTIPKRYPELICWQAVDVSHAWIYTWKWCFTIKQYKYL